jgi:plastocyanin
MTARVDFPVVARGRRTVVALVTAAALAAAMLPLGCFSERSSPTDPVDGGITGTCRIPVGSSVVGSVQAVIAIKDFTFVPETLRVPRGTTVSWVNCEEDFANEQHNATSESGAWATALLSPTAIDSRRFDEAGVFPYLCEPHPFMKATIIVE